MSSPRMDLEKEWILHRMDKDLKILNFEFNHFKIGLKL